MVVVEYKFEAWQYGLADYSAGPSRTAPGTSARLERGDQEVTGKTFTWGTRQPSYLQLQS
jgi:hypothetical protein